MESCSSINLSHIIRENKYWCVLQLFHIFQLFTRHYLLFISPSLSETLSQGANLLKQADYQAAHLLPFGQRPMYPTSAALRAQGGVWASHSDPVPLRTSVRAMAGDGPPRRAPLPLQTSSPLGPRGTLLWVWVWNLNGKGDVIKVIFESFPDPFDLKFSWRF